MPDDKKIEIHDMNNAERFLAAFIKIEKQLKIIINTTKYTKFYPLLAQAGRVNSIVRNASLDIQEYADLRNAIVHQRSGQGEIIAQPIDDVVNDIESLAQRIADPACIDPIFLCPVRICSPDDSLIAIMKQLKEYHHSKIPVYNETGFIRLLTTDAIAKWLLDYLPEPNLKDVLVKDILVSDEEQNNVAFLKSHATVEEAISLFESGLTKGRSLIAVLITKHGYPSQIPSGIITVADLPKLYELLQGT